MNAPTQNASHDHYEDPTHCVVCTFDEHAAAIKVKPALHELGFAEDQIEILDQASEASEVDTSAKWFADTDVEMEKFQDELRAGKTLLSVPVKECNCLDEVYQILKNHGARHITHFGEWVTQVLP